MADFDVTIVGAGAVGLACAYALARRGQSVVVLERENRIGAGVSSRNSEVIHAGLHYATGSLKARLCVEGRRALYPFLDAHSVAYDKCGKLIVATEDAEIPALEGLLQQGEINSVEGMRRIEGAEARALEPQLRAVAAIESVESGLMDAHGYMLALEGEIEARGGAIALNAPFLGASPGTDGYSVRVGGEAATTISTGQLIIAAGLGAQTCARGVENFPAARIPKLYLGKGSYFALQGVKAPFARLIYPPPIPGALGTHYRRDLGGVARFGPDLQFVDHEDYVVDPARAASFYDTVRRFWPSLPDGALQPDYSGIRPKLHGPGEPQDDFVIDDTVESLICLFGIESPGLTSSLAIGEEVARRLGV
ncbi:NAD(P)/FAD-dependent oxidoreductase [Terricaulis silvestris]|uniref:L-2-hydroxyglutarate oxidase LhgO n=1 Tax=Terricaulis silvestris TaxID=2686094 RepID=A0A6I6MRU6_9CAUL|nr:NAD(P)/FAD-dependent oxidoreductase [Terricaulis silvestris]QGZ95354.1 L-2-hydroxyglutarate oxidase LhgO [Terricaulis silvestris]